MLNKKLTFSFLFLILSAKMTADIPDVQDGHFSAEISVEKSSSNSWEAKELAIQEAKVLALQALITKLCFSGDQEVALRSLEAHPDLIRSVKVCEEAAFQHTFKAKFKISFKAPLIQEVFASSEIPFTLQKPNKCLVLVFCPEGFFLERQELMAIWPKRSNVNLLTYVDTVEGLEERLLWHDSHTLEKQQEILRYYTLAYPDVFIITLTYAYNQNSHEGVVVHVNCPSSQAYLGSFPLSSDDEVGMTNVLAHVIEDAWKGQSFARGWEEKEVFVTYDMDNIKGWKDFCFAVSQNPLVRRSAVRSLNSKKGILSLTVSRNYQRKLNKYGDDHMLCEGV